MTMKPIKNKNGEKIGYIGVENNATVIKNGSGKVEYKIKDNIIKDKHGKKIGYL